MNDVNAVYYEEEARPVYYFLQLYDAGRVQRFHTTPDYSGTPRQNLAEHQWGVALLCRELCRRANVACSARLLVAALTHDLAEYWTADVPAHVKWAHPSLREPLEAAQTHVEVAYGIWNNDLPAMEQRILKFADSIELYVYSRQRARAGTTSYAAVARNIYDHVLQWAQKNESPDREGLEFLAQLKGALA